MLDVEAALSYITRDPRLSPYSVGCFGISMGGAIGLLAGARFPSISALVSDSAYADLGRAIARGQWLAYHIPRVPLGQMVIWATALRLYTRMSSLNPVQAIGRISPRRILLIHGLKDRSIPPEEARILFAAAGEPKELWLVPEAEHVGCFYRERSEYVKRVVGFFQDAFSGTAKISPRQ